MHPSLLHNGRIRSTTDPLLLPGQIGFLNGWGIFSTLRVDDGVLFAYERHYRRMQNDAHRLRVPMPLSDSELEAQLVRLIEVNRAFNATLRVAIVRNTGGLFEAPNINSACDVIAFTTELNDWGRGVRLSYQPNARFGAGIFAGTKCTSWAENLTLHEEAHEQGFDEFILLNENGHVSECTSANIFAIEGDNVWTPPLVSSGCLPGVTRALLLEEIKVPGLSFRERDLTPADLESCQASFITSSTRDVLPIMEIDGETVSRDEDRLEAIRAAFLQYRANYVGQHRHESVGV